MNWKSIIATGLVTGLVAIVTGMGLFYWQLREPELAFSVVESAPFPGEEENFAIQHVEIRNDGKKEVTNVSVAIEIPGSDIRDYKVISAAGLEITEESEEHALVLRFPSLNPSERLTVSLLVTGPLQSLVAPVVSARGDGVLGVQARAGQETDFKTTLYPVIVAAYAAVFAALLVSKRNRRVLSLVSRSMLGGNLGKPRGQSDVFVTLLSIHGKSDLIPEFLSDSRVCRYWSEADYLTARAIQSGDTEETEDCREILLDLLNLATTMATSSEAIVHYDIARLSAHIGDQEKLEHHLEIAKGLDPSETSARLSIDPLIDSEEEDDNA